MSGGWIVEALVASTLLMGAVLLLRARVRRWFGPQVAYAMWALPALRLVLPPVPAGWRGTVATPMAQVGETITVLVVPAGGPVTTGAGPSVGALLLALWAGGAAAFLLWHAERHRRFCRRLLASAEWIDARGDVAVIASDAARGPLAFGLRDRYVAFPRDFAERYDAQERALALEHEIGHHARGDLLANWAALVVLALHWCNPVAWRAFRAFRCDQELANDARVLAGRSRADAHVYACAILKAAHGGAVSMACHLHTIEDLKGRLKMLTNSRVSRRRLAGGAATVALLGTLGLGLTMSGSRAAAAITDTVAERIAVAQATPAAPAAPPAPAAAAKPVAPAAPARPPRPVKRVTVVKDGHTTVYEGAEADAYARANDLPIPPLAPIPPLGVRTVDGPPFRIRMRDRGAFAFAKPPEMTTRACAADEGDPRWSILTTEKDGKRAFVICSNRIDARVAAAGPMRIRSIETARGSIESARRSLDSARSSIVGNRDLSADQRREALDGIDQALAELKNDPLGD